MAHKFNPEKKEKLDNGWRRKVLPPRETLIKMGLEPGDIMADIGCGIGYFATEGAKIVGESGSVFGMDILDEMLSETEEKAKRESISNIETLKTEEYDLKLDDESATYAFTVNVVHEVEDKERFLKEANRVLKDGGRIAVIDFEKREMEMGPPLDHRVSAGEMEDYLEGAGFKVSKRFSFSEVFYGILAVKQS